MNFIQKYYRCSRDIVYFIEECLGIELYPFQKGILWSLQYDPALLVVAGRQCGKTTMLAYFAIWSLLFKHDHHITIAVLQDSYREGIQSLIRKHLKALDIPLGWDKVGYMSVPWGSDITISNYKVEYYRGRVIDTLLLDEFAFLPINAQKEFVDTVFPIIMSRKDSTIGIISTKFKDDDTFYKMYVESKHPKLNEKGFKSIAVNWWDVPGRDKQWCGKIIQNTGPKQFDREYLADF